MTTRPRVAEKTVLVADDTAFVRDRFKVAIEGAGHKAVTAQNGPELIGRMRTSKDEIDLVVLDLRLPQGNGVSMLRAIRKMDQERPPVMIFSGTIASADEVRELGTLGVTGYVNEYMAVQHIVPGVTTYQEVLELCGSDVEEQSRLTDPGQRRLVYRGRRVVPRRRRAFGWLSTVAHWDVEQHEVHIDLERDVVRDVQARVTRSRLNAPEPS